MKITKNCLSTEDIINISSNMLQYNTYIEREICKYLLLADICTDFEVLRNEEDIVILDFKQYDELLENDNISVLNTIRGIDLIDKEVEYSESVPKTVKDFLDSLNKKIENINIDPNSLNVDNVLNSIKNIMEKK